jgi:hypothetical protein
LQLYTEMRVTSNTDWENNRNILYLLIAHRY